MRFFSAGLNRGGTRPGDVLLPSRAALPVARPPPLGSRRLLTRAMVTTVPPGAGSHSPRNARAGPVPTTPRPGAALRPHPAHPGVQRQFPLRRIQRRTAVLRPLATKPLEKRRHPVRFAPIWPISVHYSDRSRHAARSRAQRPRGRLLAATRLAGPPAGDRPVAGNAIALASRPRRGVGVPSPSWPHSPSAAPRRHPGPSVPRLVPPERRAVLRRR